MKNQLQIAHLFPGPCGISRPADLIWMIRGALLHSAQACSDNGKPKKFRRVHFHRTPVNNLFPAHVGTGYFPLCCGVGPEGVIGRFFQQQVLAENYIPGSINVGQVSLQLFVYRDAVFFLNPAFFKE